MPILVIPTGLFHGRWIPYRRRTASTSRLPLAVLCGRCGERTTEPGGTGWVYRRSEPLHPTTQLCPACVAVLRGLHGVAAETP